MRNTQIIPSNIGKDLFHVTNGTLIQNLSFVGAANTGAIIAFPPEGVVNRHKFLAGYGAEAINPYIAFYTLSKIIKEHPEGISEEDAYEK